MSPELETLDQLQGGDLRLDVVAKLFPSSEDFERGVLGLLSSGDVKLKTDSGLDVPNWKWKGYFTKAGTGKNLNSLKLGITPQGARS